MRTVRRDDDEHDVVADGESVRGPLMLKDGWPNRSGFVSVNSPAVRDAQRMARDARQAWIKRMCDAWRMPVSVTPVKDAAEPDAAEALLRRHLGTEPDDDAQARRDRAYADYCARVSQAWQQPNPAARANSVERQRKQWTAER
jgi:hypothetical protein